jgi:diadenosine tetraphosphatase ApaH/serine/threonine PP2A family protein phosphatase
VLADIDAAGATRIWCLGDTMGYGPYVNECMHLVSRRCEFILAGNHDLAVRGDIPGHMFGGSAGVGIAYARDVMDVASEGILAGLQPAGAVDGVGMFHGSARDPIWEYVRDFNSARAHFAEQPAALSFVGHTHAQLIFELPDGEDYPDGGQAEHETIVPLSAGVRRVVNPGSVGQPRDRDPRAAWALLEPTRITFRRVEYDLPRMQQAVRDAGLPADVGDRLELGW